MILCLTKQYVFKDHQNIWYILPAQAKCAFIITKGIVLKNSGRRRHLGIQTLITAIFTRSSWTSQTRVSIPKDIVVLVTKRKFTARFRYPADFSESKAGSYRFLMRTKATSGSHPIVVRHLLMSSIDSKKIVCRQMSTRREKSC